jgi:hypothetical protein
MFSEDRMKAKCDFNCGIEEEMTNQIEQEHGCAYKPMLEITAVVIDNRSQRSACDSRSALSMRLSSFRVDVSMGLRPAGARSRTGIREVASWFT